MFNESEYKKKLEEVIKKLDPDSDEFWKKYTIEEIPGIPYSIESGVKMRKDDQEKWEFTRQGDYIWVPNKELYEKLKKEGYNIVLFHQSYIIPLMFKESKDGRPDWFAPPGFEKKKN